MGPIAARERIETIDIVRGMALFGILASNMRAFNSPLAAYMDHSLMWQGQADRWVQGFVDLLVTGKFITIFSFLFGLGFAVFMERAATRGPDATRFYLRRMSFLLVLGLIHASLFWYGDILAPYALMGLVLYAFRNRGPRTVLGWAFALYFWPLFVSALMMTLSLAGVPIPPFPSPTPEQLQATIQTYSAGSFRDILVERMRDNGFMLMGLFFFYPRCLGLFLFGLWVWRKGIVQNLPAHEHLFRRCRNWGLLLGLALNAVVVVLIERYHPNPMGNDPLMVLINLCSSLGVPALSLGYISSVALLCMDLRWRDRLQPFAAVGRTALTNYLLQTLLCTTLYYSYGFALYGTVGPLAGMLLTGLIYGGQVWASERWMRTHAFGPVEWLWRAFTYRSAPNMKATPAET